MAADVLDFYLAIVFVVIALVARRYVTRTRIPLPPGPKGLPLIGNVLQVPKDFSWLRFGQWGDEYGDIVHISIVSQPFIILNSTRACISLLDQKSVQTSDRAILTMAHMSGWDATLPFMQYGQRWKDYRRILHRSIGTKTAMEKGGLLHLEEEGAKAFARRLMKREGEGDIIGVIRKSFGAMLLKMSFGYEIKEEGEDYFMHLQQQLIDQVTELTTPGAFLVDLFPSLQHLPPWLPGTGFMTKAKTYRKILNDVIDKPHAFVKQQIASNQALPSITFDHLKDDLDEEQDYCLRWAIGAIYGAGIDTSVTAIQTFFLLMCLYPDVQRKAQAEIDAFLGENPDRLPKLVDRESLPYVDAVLKECLRWNPVAPLGMPHRMSEDVIHEGYLLPKNAWVFANLWKLAHDAETYKNPMNFDPERFIVSLERQEPEQDPRSICFGFGRRICPGLTLADTSIFLFCTTALTVFDISHGAFDSLSADETSLSKLRASVEFDSSIVCAPKPFDCRLRPRSDRAIALVQNLDEQK